MRTYITVLTFVCGLMVLSNQNISAQESSEGSRAYIGIRMDVKPLDELLIKHLRLKPDQGLLIRNVQTNSPADKAHLERDDIIIAFDGRDVTDFDDFVASIQKAGVGKQISLEIIHLGKRRTVTLAPSSLSDSIEWKYPEEPEFSQKWQPGRAFRLRPDRREWQEIPFGQVPDGKNHFKKFFQQRYPYHHTMPDGESYDITIEGDPRDDDASITVKVGKMEYKTTVSKLDKLPEKYREAAHDALANAKESAQNNHLQDRAFDFTPPGLPGPPGLWGDDNFGRSFPRRGHQYRFGPGPRENINERMQRQMQELRERMKEMEKMFNRLPNAPDEKDSLTDDAEQL